MRNSNLNKRNPYPEGSYEWDEFEYQRELAIEDERCERMYEEYINKHE